MALSRLKPLCLRRSAGYSGPNLVAGRIRLDPHSCGSDAPHRWWSVHAFSPQQLWHVVERRLALPLPLRCKGLSSHWIFEPLSPLLASSVSRLIASPFTLSPKAMSDPPFPRTCRGRTSPCTMRLLTSTRSVCRSVLCSLFCRTLPKLDRRGPSSVG